MNTLNLKLKDQRVEISNESWFRNWFNSSFYHSLYSNRDEHEAAGFISQLIQELQAPPGSKILDLGCGNGRHSKFLSRMGFNVTGIDLAASSIRMARQSEHEGLHFYRQDMRQPFGVNLYNYVFSFFTSFGYFKDEEDNHRVIRNIQHSLLPGGVLMMDFLNVPYAENRLVPFEEKEIDGIHYHIHRWTDASHFYKKISIDLESGEPLEFTEQVAKLQLCDFNELFVQDGLKMKKVYGDYDLNEYDRESSPRLIMVAQKV